MVRRERPRQRAAVERLQDRRLDLDEALPVEVGADRGDDPRAVDEQLAGVLACDQVELAAAIAGLDVAQPVVLVGRRAQRLGEDLKAIDAQRQLAAAAAQRRAVDADQIAEVERAQPREGSSPSTSMRACSWILPVRSTRSRNAALPEPRRAAIRPATRWASSVSSPSPGARRRRGSPRSAPCRGTSRGTPRGLPPSAAAPSRGARRSARSGRAGRGSSWCVGLARCRSQRRDYLRPTSIFVIFSLRAGRAGPSRRPSRCACGRAARVRRGTRWRACSPPAWPPPSRRSCT